METGNGSLQVSVIPGVFTTQVRVTNTSMSNEDRSAHAYFSCRLAGRGLFRDTPQNLARNGYVSLSASSITFSGKTAIPTNVYVKARFINSIRAVQQINQASQGGVDGACIRKVYDFFKYNTLGRDVYLLAAERGDTRVLNENFSICVYLRGKSSSVINRGEEIIDKIFRGTQEEYLDHQNKIGKIMDLIHQENPLIGLPERATYFMEHRSITIYDPKTGQFKINEEGFHYREKAYKADGVDPSAYTKEELPSMFACLVQGSKTLFKYQIYHLDVKPENVGYKGNGIAEHFDLDGSLIAGESNEKGYTFSKNYTLLGDQVLLENSQNPEDVLKKMHIFQLGVCFFNMATGAYPYILTRSGFPSKEFNSVDVDNHLAECCPILTPEQRNLITRMVSFNMNIRPSIEEIESGFPIDLIQTQVETLRSQNGSEEMKI